MKNHLLRRVLSMILVVAMLMGFYVPAAQAASTGLSWKESDQRVKFDLTDRKAETHVEEAYAPTDIVRVSIVLEDKPTVQAGFPTRNIAQSSQAMAYRRQLQAKQNAMANTISTQVLGGKKLDVAWNLTLVGNIISANVPYGKLDAIRALDGVEKVFLETAYAPCVAQREENTANPQMFSSLGMAGSYQVWTNGYTGAGSRIAVIDTGTDTDHQSLDSDAFLYALEQNAQAKGISYDKYIKDLDLLDALEIASVLSDLNIYKKISGLSAADLYLNEKLAFAANYVDGSLVVDHEHDYQGEHGSHVAGIAAANRYIPQGSGYAEAIDTVLMAGMAPDAQLITMKVFGKGSPFESDYMAAVEDAILLNCDAVNLSLGTPMAGAGFSKDYGDLLDYMTTTDTVVVASAGNSYSWPFATTFGYLYSDDVNLDTVGSPGSYPSFFTVASVENDGGVMEAFRVAGSNFGYADSAVNGYCYPLSSLDLTADSSGTDYEYVFIDGLGYTEDYAGMDLDGKIVFCSRGELNFSVKANNAVDLGAAAVIVYNNDDSGLFGMNLDGYRYYEPCVSITKADAAVIRSASTQRTTSGGLTYYTGKMTVMGRQVGINYGSEYYAMSDFSSWGVPGGLTLKPEITAPGGSIYSLWGTNNVTGGGTDQYELMSGTSMAAPAVAGMTALVAQYIREKNLDTQEGLKARVLAQSLLMSTAVPMIQADSGSYYSLMNQGAGLARVDLATAADSYILVEGQSDGKVKAELGDDPDRTGVYEFSFSINNLSGREEHYALSADVFRQGVFDLGLVNGQEAYGFTQLDTKTTELAASAVFTVNGVQVDSQTDLSDYDLNGNGQTDAQDADYLLEYLLGNASQLHGEGDVSGDGTVSTYDAHILLAKLSSNGLVTVPANGSVTVKVKLTLPESSKALLDASYSNGTYVEAYVYAESVSDEEGLAGTVHSIPVLAFYGNWSDPNMFDHESYIEILHTNVDHIPYLYQLIGSGNALTISYGDGEEYYFGGNPYILDDVYMPQRNAFNSEDASTLAAQYFTLIRNASDMQLLVRNADTGELYLRKQLGALDAAYYSVNYGEWDYVQQGAALNWTGKGADGNPLPEGTNVEVSLVAVPEYYRNADGSHDYEALGKGAYLTTWFTIDNTAPEALSINLVDTTLTVTAQDNEYVATVALMNASGTAMIDAANPNQTQEDAVVSVDLEVTDVIGKAFLVVVYDYAGNASVYEVQLDLPEVDRPYLTVVDSQTATYYGLDPDGNSLMLAVSDRGQLMAAEFVDGYVFEVSNGDQLYVAPDDDLNNFRYLTDLDPDSRYGITNFCDLAFNYADNKLYGLFYCEANSEMTSMLCTIDMFSGTMTVLGEMPVDVNTLAIDDDGNFYSAAYGQPYLYTYTIDDLAAGEMTLVGIMSYYGTDLSSSMAWDHDADVLYWAFPNTLLMVDTTTAEPTLLHYNTFQMVGLYIVPQTYGNRFAPIGSVTGVTLDQTESRTLVGQTIGLTAQVWPWNVTDDTVTWSSSDTSVATVDANGTVTGLSQGTTTITATSNLDSGKSASCTFTVEKLDHVLHGLVWDYEGDIWWSEINTGSLPTYTKLTTEPAEDYIASTALMPDGTLYAATADLSTGFFRSSVYTVNPDTFQLTKVGNSSDGYVDIAPAPYIRGGALAAVYGQNVLFVNTATGDYYSGPGDIFYMFNNPLVGIAYMESTAYQHEWELNGEIVVFDSYIDWYFLVDTEGYVYLLGWIEAENGRLYYFEHPDTTQGIYTVIPVTTDMDCFSSLYYGGDFLYYSCYSELKNVSTLYAIDTVGNHKTYTLGNFGDGIWPVSGLMEPDTTSGSSTTGAAPTAEPRAAEESVELAPLTVSAGNQAASGGLNATSGNVVAPQSSSEYDEEKDQVTVQLTGISTAPNGRMTVTYDATALTFTGITGHTKAFAYTAEEGKITVAFAAAAEMPEDTTVATLTFRVVKPGDQTITVSHTEAWDEPCSRQEMMTVSAGCSHSYDAVVTEPTCEDQGYTTYTCSKCGDTYVDDYTDPVDHVYEDGACKWCGTEEYIVTWKSVNTTLTGSIDLNFYVVLSDNLVTDPSTFVRFTCAGKTVDVPMSQAIISVKDGVTRYRFGYKVYAKQMTDTVTAQVMTENGPVGKALSYSVAKYCYNEITANRGAELVAVCKAMLNYGAAAQTHFSYRLDDLANADLSADDRIVASFDPTPYAHSKIGTGDGINASSAKLLLTADVAIQVAFTLTGSKPIEAYTVTIDGKAADYVNVSGSKYYFELAGIAASKFDELHAFSAGGQTLYYSVLSYANQIRNTGSADLIHLLNAMYAYHAATDNYVN